MRRLSTAIEAVSAVDSVIVDIPLDLERVKKRV